MAVNGIEIEVGQKWKTSGGGRVTIESNDGHGVFPWNAVCAQDGAMRSYTSSGSYCKNGASSQDLIELMQHAGPKAPRDAGDLMSVSVKGGIATEDRRDTSSALAIQVGGTHYKDFAIQPVEYIHANKLGFCEGNVVKYITRHAAKNGADDIRKVIHYCQLLLELQYGVKKEGESK